MSLVFEKQQDVKVDEEKMMVDLLKDEKFQLFMSYIDKLRSEAMYMVLAVDVESKTNRMRLKTLDDIIGLPQFIIKKSKALKNNEAEDE